MDEFYFHQMDALSPGKVRDDYLGGEPLLKPDLILESASRRYYFCRGRKIDYGFSITTNGTLITSRVIRMLAAVGLESIRVSIAGPAEVHDALRPLANGDGTYGKIMNNLQKIGGLVPIRIECQYDAANNDYKQIPEMLDDLKARNLRVENIAYHAHFIKPKQKRIQWGLRRSGTISFPDQSGRQARLSGKHGAPLPTCACRTTDGASSLTPTGPSSPVPPSREVKWPTET